MYNDIYTGKNALITGHTGFKGAWLTIYLQHLGANVVGYALDPPGQPNLFEKAGLEPTITHYHADIRDTDKLAGVLREHEIDVVFHLAAQALVITSYEDPLETFDVNVMGSLSVLEAVRRSERRCMVMMIATDKVYENREWHYGYRENDPLGGFDPYSASKAAMEIAVASYRSSFFNPAAHAQHGVAVASGRAGNVIGGGDWADKRIIPDAVREFAAGRLLEVRSPRAVRPWQHVLEPLSGYLWVVAKLCTQPEPQWMSAWNFGPQITEVYTVADLIDAVIAAWGSGEWRDVSERKQYHEAGLLQLSIDRAHALLGWKPVWDFPATVERTVKWYKHALTNDDAQAIRNLCLDDIRAYESTAAKHHLAWTR
ncbi:MAG: CDP-glucose 4,6-dehydratase [Chloroflexota bacterium]